MYIYNLPTVRLDALLKLNLPFDVLDLIVAGFGFAGFSLTL
jgi:hypothetical protein